ncbi:MAG: cysteine desulfurase family protein [Gammaproteobacteria bacterium]
MIYFDYNATSPLKPAVLEAMLPYYRECYGNPSSLHRLGRLSRDAVEHARVQLASLIGASPSEILFSSGGTESNRLAIRGGGQEKGLRAGTENVAAIVGFGAAAEIARQKFAETTGRLLTLKRKLEQGLKKLSSVTIFSENAERLPNTLMFGLPGTDGEMMVREMDRRGIALSSGSACSSQSTEPSPVLLAMGVDPDLVRSAVGVSLGPENTEAEIEQFLNVLYRMAPGHAARAVG